MKAIVVWLWNDTAPIAPPPVAPLPLPIRPVAPTPTAELRVDLQKKLPFRQRQELRIRRIRERQAMLRAQRTPAFRPPRLFLPAHVNIAQKMFARHLKEPHRFICIADTNEGLSSEVEFLKTPAAAAAVANLRSPEGPRFPSCYRRLWSFSDEARALGDRILVVDIDIVLTGDVAPLFQMPGDFVGWVPERAWGQQHRFGGGIYMLTPGTRTSIWDRFKGYESIREARTAGYRGSDQAWMSYTLSAKEPYWPRNSGIHSVRELGASLDLPKGARIVQFNGHKKPWHYKQGWVADHWR